MLEITYKVSLRAKQSHINDGIIFYEIATLRFTPLAMTNVRSLAKQFSIEKCNNRNQIAASPTAPRNDAIKNDDKSFAFLNSLD